MLGLKKISILLKDSDENEGHNIQIMEYLNDRHRAINDAGYAIAIDIVEDDNINNYIKQGVISTPALILSDGENGLHNDAQYGVNAIIAALAKLEVIQTSDHFYDDNQGSNPEQSFRDIIIQEMMSSEQEDESTLSKVRAKGQDLADRPPDEKDIDAKMAKYESYYSGRGKIPVSKKNKQPDAAVKIPSAKQNIEKLIAVKGYDKGEAAFMREIASKLE
jgi:hypothetical protein